MRLAELDANFIKVIDDKTWQEVKTIDEADGVKFLCPKCYKENQGPIGTHSIVCWRPRPITENQNPKPGRWEFEGSGLHDLTLVAGSSSVFLQTEGGCKAHFYVRNGEITFC